MVPGVGPSDPHASDRAKLQTDLLSAVKQCQTRFGGRTELATELDSNVVVLCNVLELVLCHGLKNGSQDKRNASIREQVSWMVLGEGGGGGGSSWEALSQVVSVQERERFEALGQVWTDRGRTRAFLRAALNEASLPRHLRALVASPALPRLYHTWALLRDPEAQALLPTIAQGLGSILFAMSINRTELNHVSGSSHPDSAEQLIEEPLPRPVKKKQEGRRHKKGTTNIISFDDDEESEMNNGLNRGTNNAIKQDNLTTSVPASIDIRLEEDEVEDEEENEEAVECAEDAVLCELDLSDQSDTEDRTHHPETSMGLRPVSDSSVGELMPVALSEETHSSEDSVSVPSFSEENDVPPAGDKKEETVNIENLQREVEKLRRSLDQVNDLNTSLRSQIVQSNQQLQNNQQEVDAKIQELNRENELLKHQLRKYVNAVKLLKQEVPAQGDASLYEQKLVQVAEMHAELMELNERLQRNLGGKEEVIRRLYWELEALRGPLGPTEVDIHSLIISLWVPSVFLTGASNPFHVYQVHIRIGDEEWNVYRRYAQFYLLHKELKKKYPVISAFQFPPKKTIGNKDSRFVEERRLKLQQYLRRLMNHLVANIPQLASAPSKPLITSLLPFFGEQNEPLIGERQRPRSSLPRVSDTPQYSGL